MTTTYAVRTTEQGNGRDRLLNGRCSLAEALEIARRYTGAEPVQEADGRWRAQGAPISRGEDLTMAPGPWCVVEPEPPREVVELVWAR